VSRVGKLAELPTLLRRLAAFSSLDERPILLRLSAVRSIHWDAGTINSPCGGRQRLAPAAPRPVSHQPVNGAAPTANSPSTHARGRKPPTSMLTGDLHLRKSAPQHGRPGDASRGIRSRAGLRHPVRARCEDPRAYLPSGERLAPLTMTTRPGPLRSMPRASGR
jgi:hypothetical protein